MALDSAHRAPDVRVRPPLCPCCAEYRDVRLEPIGDGLYACPGCRGERGQEPCSVVAGMGTVREPNPDGEHLFFVDQLGRVADLEEIKAAG